MSKLTLALLAACALAGVSSAATVDWTAASQENTYGTYNTQVGTGDNGGLSSGQAGAIHVSLTLTLEGGGTAPDGWLVTFGGFGGMADVQGRDKNLGAHLYYENGVLKASMSQNPSKNDTSLADYTTAMTATGNAYTLNTDGTQANDIAIVIERGTSSTATASIFINGVEVFTYDGPFSGFPPAYVAIGTDMEGQDPITGVTIGDAEVGYQAGLTADDLKNHYASQVPEPTALALLALGVAGLALRRRAA